TSFTASCRNSFVYLPYGNLSILTPPLSYFTSTFGVHFSYPTSNTIAQFRLTSENPAFWYRPSESLLVNYEKEVRKGLFASAASAMALVDNSRRVAKKIVIDCYQNKVEQMFAKDEQHIFIQNLRNFVTHRHILQPDWTVHYSVEGRYATFRLKSDVLFRYKKWEPLAINFIEKNKEGIDIDILFSTYREKVIEFHNWFHSEIIKVSEPQLSDYRKYEKWLKQFSLRADWNLLLSEAIKRNINPYDYLNRYFTKDELSEINSLPHRSQAQVDRMIETLDDANACNDKIRRLAYKLFGLISD
ncbi:MAG: hypothetical protein M0Z70_05945, partial [Nitrospiraceae bacterium]|nr:hypothetical protein [Nitrospiraceae bacterium]